MSNISYIPFVCFDFFGNIWLILFIVAKLSLNSTQTKAEISLISTLIQPPRHPPNHPEKKITCDFFKIIQDYFQDASRLIKD